MGAGDMLAGEGLAGQDDLPTLTEVSVARAAAIYFDAVTRDFPLDASGRHIAIHPVDSEMQMACHIGLGTVAASTGTGNALRSIKYIDPRRIGAQVKDAIRVATARLVARGDVTIDKVSYDAKKGRLLVAVDYWNNRLPGTRDQQRRTATASN